MMERLAGQGFVRQVIMPPIGALLDGTIQAVEALIRTADGEAPQFTFLMEFEDSDLDELEHGGKIWFTLWGTVVPFGFQVTP